MMRIVLALLMLTTSSCVRVSPPDDCGGEGTGSGVCAPASPTTSPNIQRILYENPSPRWLISYPSDWHLQTFQAGCLVTSSGAVVSNLNRVLDHIPRDEPPECTIEWDLREVSESFVGVEIARIVGGPYRSPATGPDTELPLKLDAESLGPLDSEWVRPGTRGKTLRATFNREPGWNVRVWAGLSASEEDQAEAERIVASLTFALSDEARRSRGRLVSPRADVPRESKAKIEAVDLNDRSLVTHFIGNPCAAILAGVQVEETPSSVTITLWTGRDPRFDHSDGSMACTMQGEFLKTEISLARTLGERAVIDGSTGRAVEEQ